MLTRPNALPSPKVFAAQFFSQISRLITFSHAAGQDFAMTSRIRFLSEIQGVYRTVCELGSENLSTRIHFNTRGWGVPSEWN